MDGLSLIGQAAAAGGGAPAAAGDAAGSPLSGILSLVLPLTPAFLLFYLLVLRPQQQQERKRRETIGAMKKNDKVLTSAGIFGTVVSVDPESDRAVVRIDDDKGVKISILKSTVARVIDSEKE